MWEPWLLKRIDFRTIPIIICLMTVSVMTISSVTCDHSSMCDQFMLSSTAKNQLTFFGIGIFVYLVVVSIDYKKIREWTWFLYLFVLLLLVGLYFTTPIHHVRRWYRFALIPFDIQPSECAKLVTVLALSWFLEKKIQEVNRWKTFLQVALIVFVPFLLILKQPDLGTALILCPITIVMLYFSGVKSRCFKVLSSIAATLFGMVLMIFLGILSHDDMRPLFTTVMKEYQYERLNPNTYHQKASQTAIALGKLFGTGYRKSEFTGNNWLPYAHTDSVFSAFTEEFGFVFGMGLLAVFFLLIYFSFQVALVARDDFGRLLAAGIATYLAMHIIINIGMMCGFFPITGVPLVLVSYGGSSVLSTMTALGVLQSIYARRFMFS